MQRLSVNLLGICLDPSDLNNGKLNASIDANLNIHDMLPPYVAISIKATTGGPHTCLDMVTVTMSY